MAFVVHVYYRKMYLILS